MRKNPKYIAALFFIIFLILNFGVGCSELSKRELSSGQTDFKFSSLEDIGSNSENSSFTEGTENTSSVQNTNGRYAIAGDSSDPKKSRIKNIFLSDKPLEGFSAEQTTYTVVLADNVKTPPKVTVLQSNGLGKAEITQAKSINGCATVKLNGIIYTIQFTKKDKSQMFKNTYYKLSVKKKLNVAYFGGSITYGTGATMPDRTSYRARVTSWLKNKYPGAAIRETNAAIGGTGTAYGIYRAVTDLKLESAAEKPDFVFIEFAINDIYDGTDTKTAKSNLESIIRTIYSYAPESDIFMILTTDQACMNNDFDMLVAHREIADAYKIPCLCVGKMLWEEMLSENNGQYPTAAIYSKYFSDTVHPADRGYEKYAGYITDFLEDAFSAKTAHPKTVEKSFLPTQISEKIPISPQAMNFKGQTAPSGFTIDGDGHILSSADGASFTFTFTGTDLKLWQWGTPQSGSLSVSIDGGKEINVDLYSELSSYRICNIASGLENKSHTVKITLHATAHGSTMNIWNLLISGSQSHSGLQLVN